MIVVTGASGKLGGRVVRALVRAGLADQVIVSVFEPDEAAALSVIGVDARRGDYNDPQGLDRSFAGGNDLLLVSSTATGDLARTQMRTALESAQRAGIERVVYTSHMGVGPTSAFDPMPDHCWMEETLDRFGMSYVALRHGFYTDSAIMLLGQALETGEIVVPEDGPVSWTSHDDLAEVDALVLRRQLP